MEKEWKGKVKEKVTILGRESGRKGEKEWENLGQRRREEDEKRR